jgi:uncharacterized membrane protein (TIGR02234 family)
VKGTSRERLVVLALGVLGGALALLAASRIWLTVTVNDPLAGGARLHPSGHDAAALVPAAALVALAASVAAVTMRRVGRYVAGLLLVAAGAAIAAATISVLVHPVDSAADAIRRATGRTGDLAASASVGGWPWVAVAAAVPIVLAGALTIVRGRRWSGLSGRYDAPAASADGLDPGRSSDPDGGDAPGAGREGAVDPDGAWDAVSRGEDPTS